VSSTTRLLVLGVVGMFQPVHGYDVRRELVSWHAEDWANVAPGSIYNALKSATKDGLLEIVGTKQIGSRPERTTYKLTAAGEAELDELLRATLWTVRAPVDPLVAALSLLGFIDRQELISALDARAAKIKADLERAEFVIAAIDDVETPDHVREMMRLLGARVSAELAWGRAFKARLHAGEYHTLGDPKWGKASAKTKAAPASTTRVPAKPKAKAVPAKTKRKRKRRPT
jgi:DNA-binding PadR family transcriptional regulator